MFEHKKEMMNKVGKFLKMEGHLANKKHAEYFNPRIKNEGISGCIFVITNS